MTSAGSSQFPQRKNCYEFNITETNFLMCDPLRDLVLNALKRCSNGWPKRRSNKKVYVRKSLSRSKSEKKRFSQSICMAFNLLFDI